MARETRTDESIDIAAELDRLRRKSTRMKAVARLGEAGVVEAIEPLLRLCRRASSKDRTLIAQALARMGGAAADPLARHGLGDKSSPVRRCAAYALTLIGPAAGPALESLLVGLEDESPAVRLQVIDALGQVGDPRVVGPLVELLGDDDREVRERAAAALGEMGEAALAAVSEVFRGGGALQARIAAVDALRRIGGGEVEALLRGAVTNSAESRRLRVAILSILGDLIGENMVPIAESALADQDARIRRQAVRCLCDIDLPSSTARLMTLYQDEDKKVRALALGGLQARYRTLLERLGADEWDVLPALLAAWRAMGKKQTDEDNDIARSLVRIGKPLVPALVASLAPDQHAADVINVLAQIGPDALAGYDALVAQLDNPRIATRCAAANALGALGDDRAVPVLAARLPFDDDLLHGKKRKGRRARKGAMALQRAAALGLGRLGKASLAAALSAARSDDRTARLGGVIALGQIGGGRALATLERALLDEEDVVREAAAEAMERVAAQDVTRLGRMLKNEDDGVRTKAVKALSRLDDLRSLDLLLRAYGDPSDRVSRAVVEALARREGERACSILVAAAAGGNEIAIGALQDHPARQAASALIEALDSPWSEVYGAALGAIHVYVDVFGQDGETMEVLRQAIPELTGLLQENSGKTRRLALQTLGAFGDAATVKDIAYLLSDEKQSVRLAAVRALASIGGNEVTAMLRAQLEGTADEELRDEIEGVLERMAGDEADDVTRTSTA